MPEAALPKLLAPMLSDAISMNCSSCNCCQIDRAAELSSGRLADPMLSDADSMSLSSIFKVTGLQNEALEDLLAKPLLQQAHCLTGQHLTASKSIFPPPHRRLRRGGHVSGTWRQYQPLQIAVGRLIPFWSTVDSACSS